MRCEPDDIGLAPETRQATLAALALGNVHLWQARLDQSRDCVERLVGYLSAEDIAHAAQFQFERDRDRFIVAHAALRTILGTYLHQPAASIVVSRNIWGKPGLARAHRNNSLDFNLSHSRDVALIALALNKRVGVDVEYLRGDLPIDELSNTFFSPKERKILAALPLEARIVAFFRCWCRKEAYLKARGVGLNVPLDSFDVLADVVGADPRTLVVGWSFLEPDIGPNYACTVAGEGICDIGQRFTWSAATADSRP